MDAAGLSGVATRAAGLAPDTEVDVPGLGQDAGVVSISVRVLVVDLVETVETMVAVHRGKGVDIAGRSLVVALEVALHPAVDAEVVLLEVPGARVVVVETASICGVVGYDPY